MEYDIYHDESQESGFWHGILLVPRNSREQLLNWLDLIRRTTNYKHVATLKGLKDKGPKFDCLRMWIEVGVNSLIQDLKGRENPIIYHKARSYSKLERRKAAEYNPIISIDKPPKAKFILFREKDCHKKMEDSWFSDHGAKIETTFRMGLKGGLHLLFNKTEPVIIKSIHFDGHKHYGRRINKDRIIGKIQAQLREYCEIDNNTPIDDRRSNHKETDCQEYQEYDDCQLLQLTDLLVGAFRTVLGEEKNKIQGEVSWSIKILVEKWNQGYARMQNSRWFRGICISECYLEDGQWCFQNIIRQDNITNIQLGLSFCEKSDIGF
jgi:hypothetical protein